MKTRIAPESIHPSALLEGDLVVVVVTVDILDVAATRDRQILARLEQPASVGMASDVTRLRVEFLTGRDLFGPHGWIEVTGYAGARVTPSTDDERTREGRLAQVISDRHVALPRMRG